MLASSTLGKKFPISPAESNLGLGEEVATMNGHDLHREYRTVMRRGTSFSDEVRHAWKYLLAHRAHSNPCALYQSLAFYDYLATTAGAESLGIVEIVTSSDAIAGVVPVQSILLPIQFFVGRFGVKKTLRALRLLGSEPMVPSTTETFDQLFATLDQNYGQVALFEMDAVTFEGDLWRYLFSSPFIKSHFFIHVLHGIRGCHYVPIPKTLEKHNERFPKKRRYNLRRQEKRLEAHLGTPLELTLLNSKDDVPLLLKAMEVLGASPKDWCNQEDAYNAAAELGFLYCFILRSGDRIIGLTRGSDSFGIYRIHKFYHDRSLAPYSPGTTMWQMILRRLINDQKFNAVDMGYGTPAHSFSVTNTIRQRGTVLLMRRTFSNRALITAHTAFSSLSTFFKRLV